MNHSFVELAQLKTEEEIAAFDHRAWKREAFVPTEERDEVGEERTVAREYRLERDGRTRYLVVNELEVRNYFGDEFIVVDEDHDRAYIDRRCAEFERAVAARWKSTGRRPP